MPPGGALRHHPCPVMDTDAPAYAPTPPIRLPDELRDLLSARGHTRVVAKGTIVVAEGEPAPSMYLVHEGRLRVFVSDEEGREVELNQLGPGEYFGELMLGSAVRTATVQAVEKSRLTMLARPVVEQVLLERGDLALHFIQNLVRRVQVLSRRVQGLSSMDVYGRMARLFGEMAVTENGARWVGAPMSQQAIADRVGASRGMVNRILHDLADGGYIALPDTRGGRIRLLKALPKRW